MLHVFVKERRKEIDREREREKEPVKNVGGGRREEGKDGGRINT